MPLSQSFSLIFNSLGPYRFQLLVSLALISIHTVFGFALIFLTSRFRLDHVPVFLILLFSIHHLFSVFDDWILTGISQRWMQTTRQKCLQDFLVYSEKSQANSQLDWNEVQMEVHWLGESIFSMLRSTLRKLLQIGVFSIALVWISPILFLFCGILFLLIFLLGYLFGRQINRLQEQVILEQSACSIFELEAARAMPLIRAFHQGSLFSSLHDRFLGQYTSSSILLSRFRMIFHPAQILLFLITLVVVYTAGSSLVQEGALTQGKFFSFLAGLSLLHAPLSGLSQDISLFLSVQDMKHIELILRNHPTEETPTAAISLGSISVKDLSFSYSDKDDTPLLNQLNLSFMAGTISGIRGSNGSGKTTLALLLAGVLKPVSGQVLFDGFSGTIGPVAYVDQNGTVFTLSLEENLFIEKTNERPFHESTSPFLAFLDGSSKVDCLSPEILSSGQRKSVSIERAFSSQHQVLLIDEPENAIDKDIQSVLKEKLQQLKESKSIIILFTHSDFFLSICDQVIQLPSQESRA